MHKDSRQMNVFQLQVEQLSPDSAFVAKIKVITKLFEYVSILKDLLGDDPKQIIDVTNYQ